MAKKTRRSTASRGSVNNIILEALYSGSKYGYEIIKQVEESTNGDIILKQPSLYSSLTRFENKGYVTSSWADSELGGRRHYYTLTPEGKKYYENNVLNKRSSYEFLNDDYVFEKNVFNFDDDTTSKDNIEDDEQDTEVYNYDSAMDDNEDVNSNSFQEYNFDVQDRLNSLLEDISNDEDSFETENYDFVEAESLEEENIADNIVVEELLPENEIKSEESNEECIYTHTTQEQLSSSQDTSDKVNNGIKEIYNSIVNADREDVYAEEPEYIREQKRQASMNILYGNRQQNNFSERQTDKYVFADTKPTYYIDENGITKQFIQKNNAEPEFIETNNYTQPREIPTPPFNSSDFDEIVANSKQYMNKEKTIDTKQIDQDTFDMSDEEREIRNKRFQEKFDMIADSRMVKVEESLLKDKPVFSCEDDDSIVDIQDDEEDGSYYFAYNNEEDVITEEEEPIDIQSNFKISEYDRKKEREEELFTKPNFIKINKAKFILGIVMLLIMLVETTALLVVLNSNNLLQTDDNILFVIAYVLIVAISACLIIPVFLNSNKRKQNTFKFGYSLALSILSFFVLSTLTYAINSFLGFQIDNIQYFYTKLLLPILLSFNLIIGTIVYKIISINKSLY